MFFTQFVSALKSCHFIDAPSRTHENFSHFLLVIHLFVCLFLSFWLSFLLSFFFPNLYLNSYHYLSFLPHSLCFSPCCADHDHLFFFHHCTRLHFILFYLRCVCFNSGLYCSLPQPNIFSPTYLESQHGLLTSSG